MINTNRHQRRRENTLRRQGYTDEEIFNAPDRQGGDPLFDARGTRKYGGNISEMTFGDGAKNSTFQPPMW